MSSLRNQTHEPKILLLFKSLIMIRIIAGIVSLYSNKYIALFSIISAFTFIGFAIIVYSNTIKNYILNTVSDICEENYKICSLLKTIRIVFIISVLIVIMLAICLYILSLLSEERWILLIFISMDFFNLPILVYFIDLYFNMHKYKKKNKIIIF